MGAENPLRSLRTKTPGPKPLIPTYHYMSLQRVPITYILSNHRGEALRQLRAEGVMTLAAVVQDGAVFFDEVSTGPQVWG